MVVAIVVVLLFGFTALAFDIAALVQEKRELQNGADAAALAVAKDCRRHELRCLHDHGRHLRRRQRRRRPVEHRRGLRERARG